MGDIPGELGDIPGDSGSATETVEAQPRQLGDKPGELGDKPGELGDKPRRRQGRNEVDVRVKYLHGYAQEHTSKLYLLVTLTRGLPPF